MGKVSLTIMPWLTRTLEPQSFHRVTMEWEIASGCTVKVLLTDLSQKQRRFVEAVMDTSQGTLTGQATIAVNDSLIELLKGTDTELRNGDRLLFLPAFAGGSQ